MSMVVKPEGRHLDIVLARLGGTLVALRLELLLVGVVEVSVVKVSTVRVLRKINASIGMLILWLHSARYRIDSRRSTRGYFIELQRRLLSLAQFSWRWRAMSQRKRTVMMTHNTRRLDTFVNEPILRLL
jgi:hypothetical protein